MFDGYAHVNGDRIAAILRRPAMIVVIWLAGLWRFIGAFTSLPLLAHRQDFANYYDSALALRLGLDPYTANLTEIGNRVGFETGSLIHASETPVFLLAFEPLTRFPPATAFWIWIAFNLVALALAIYLLVVRRPGLDANTACLLGALILAFYPVGWNFYWAQSQVLTMTLMVIAMRAMENRRDGAAGVVIAIAGLLRAYPFLLLGYFALRRNWRALKFAIGAAAVGVSLTVAILGFADCLNFLYAAAWLTNERWQGTPSVVSLAPFVSRMYWVLFGWESGRPVDWIRRAAAVAANLIVLGVTARATLAGTGQRDDDYRIYSLWIATSLLLSPIAWIHYLTLMVIPFVQTAIATSCHRASRRAIWMATGSYLLTSVSVPITLRLFSRTTAFQLAFPSLSEPLLETGFFALLMGYVAAYWFAVDMRNSPSGPADSETNCASQGRHVRVGE
jgi:hypothetical protein